jgi:hypothetical protein
MSAAPIPQTDPRAGYLAQKQAIDAAIARVLDSGQYILGREVESFEKASHGHVRGQGSGSHPGTAAWPA